MASKVADALQSPFVWGPGGKPLTPEQVVSARRVADALHQPTGHVPRGVWSLLGDLAGEGVAKYKEDTADSAETAGREGVADEIKAGNYMDALNNGWVTPQQSAVASALQGRQWDQSDKADDRAYQASRDARNRQWALDDRAAEWAREDPVRALQLESGQLEFDRAKSGYRALTAEEKTAAGIPANVPAQVGPDGKIDTIGGSGQTINVNTDGGSSDFYKKLDTDAGEQQATLMDAGRNAASNNMRLGQLQDLLATAPQGATGAITQFAGNMGIPMEGLNEVQAAQALINQMVPGQRPPGSGTMSDADLALFKASLPAIINQPGGNAKILATAQLINNYTIEQAKIAEKIANREITPAEGRAQQAAIPNPLADVKPPRPPGAAPEGVPSDVWAAMTPKEQALWD